MELSKKVYTDILIVFIHTKCWHSVTNMKKQLSQVAVKAELTPKAATLD